MDRRGNHGKVPGHLQGGLHSARDAEGTTDQHVVEDVSRQRLQDAAAGEGSEEIFLRDALLWRFEVSAQPEHIGQGSCDGDDCV